MPDLTPDDLDRLMARIGERLAQAGQGELDEKRLAAAAAHVLNARRGEPGSRADDMIALGATMFANTVTRDGTVKVEFLLGWADEWPDEKLAGKSFSLGFVPLAELIRGGQG